ncbi:MAG: hypothetical protein ABW321_34645 [Polyangiales bacterium]
MTRLGFVAFALISGAWAGCDDDDSGSSADAVHGDHSHEADASRPSPAADGGKPSPGDDGSDAGASDTDAGAEPPIAEAARYALCSVVIDADGERTTYIQTVPSLDEGPYDNSSAIELVGNGVMLAHGKYFYIGNTERPVWDRYTVNDDGVLEKVDSLSIQSAGADRIDYGNVIVDDETAVSVLSKESRAVVWNPSTMDIIGEIDLGDDLQRAGYELEVWTTSTHDGLVYIPARWNDWEGGRVYPNVTLLVVDPKALKVLGKAEDDRCTSGGRVVFGKDGYGYVMGDGRNYSDKMFANARDEGEEIADSCLLRIAPGATDFDPDFYYTIPSLSGGYNPISELDTAGDKVGVGFAKLFYPEKLPADVKPVDFDFWDQPSHKLWQIDLADPPTAAEVDGFPFATLGFGGSAIDGTLYMANNPEGDTSHSDVYAVDPKTKKASLKFRMDGYFNGIYKLTK